MLKLSSDVTYVGFLRGWPCVSRIHLRYLRSTCHFRENRYFLSEVLIINNVANDETYHGQSVGFVNRFY